MSWFVDDLGYANDTINAIPAELRTKYDNALEDSFEEVIIPLGILPSSLDKEESDGETSNTTDVSS